MLVSDAVRKNVVFIGGLKDADEETAEFEPTGTGVILTIEKYGVSFPHIVTAEHVVTRTAQKFGEDNICCRINTNDGLAEVAVCKYRNWFFRPGIE